MFPEVARYAETGQINIDLYGNDKTERLAASSPALRHYWFATAICYGVAALAMFGAMHLGK